MSTNPCEVCGGTDLNLVDGYYYCIECGTQDKTMMETVIERTELGDGTFGLSQKRRLTKKKTSIQMSGEWHKWHAYNFILCGLADELIVLGAKPSFKSKLLWIWTRYLKKYHNKEEYEKNNISKRNTLLFSQCKDSDESDNDVDDESEGKSSSLRDIRTIRMSMIFSMIYSALNLDKSDIQLSHLLRYIREGRLSYQNCVKYIPEECKVNSIAQWANFMRSIHKPLTSYAILKTSHALFRVLDLGSPLVPDYTTILNIFIKELCLPKEFKALIMSLMEYMPIKKTMHNFLNFNLMFPDFETIVMSYVMVGLKMCFGLDDDYEIKLSNAVAKINKQEDHLKAYRIGLHEPTQRLFSFHEWSTYLEYRKITLCKFYQPMAVRDSLYEDHFLFTELLKDTESKSQFKKIADELAYDILNKIPQKSVQIIAKEDFPVSLTPLTTYTEFVLPRVRDPTIRLLLSEDFTKYSLKYACCDLKLQNHQDDENIIVGVTENNKIIKSDIVGSLKFNKPHRFKKVFVLDDDNKEWFKQECDEHIKYDNDDSTDKVPADNMSINLNNTSKMKSETIEELDEDLNIFGEKFDDVNAIQIEIGDRGNTSIDDPNQSLVFEFSDAQLSALQEPESDGDHEVEPNIPIYLREFNPLTFDREEVIKLLMLNACRKYKIPIPPCYKERKTPAKRKASETPTTRVKKPRATKTGQTVSDILEKYKLYMSNICSRPLGNATLPLDPDIVPNQETETQINENPNEDTMPQINESQAESQDDYDISSIHACETKDGNSLLLDTHHLSMDDEVIDAEDILKLDIMAHDKVNEIRDIISQQIAEEKVQSERINTLKEKILDTAPSLKEESDSEIEDRECLQPLLAEPDKVYDFHYYCRHYKKRLLVLSRHRTLTFEQEIDANCPKSLKFMLHTCASVIETAPYKFYIALQHLETELIKRLGSCQDASECDDSKDLSIRECEK